MAEIQQPSVSTLSGEEVVEPTFITLKRPSGSGFCVDLYLQLFDRVGPDTWLSLPEDQWHRLATIEPGWITMYPIYTNPHTQRYRDPKHGNVRCILYETKTSRTLPDTPDDAMLFIDLSLPRKLFNSCYEGLGLVKHLTPLWRGLRLAPHVQAIAISSEIDAPEIDGTVFLREALVDECRRACMRITRARRKSENSAQLHWVMS